MKKFSFILAIVLLLNLSGCAGKPKDVSDGVYKISCDILSICDDFFDETITNSEAHYEIKRLSEKLRSIEDTRHLTSRELSISITVLNLDLNFLLYNETKTYSDILKERNDLAKSLNKPQRKE